MDLSKLSTQALQDLKASKGDLSKVRTSTLQEMKAAHPDTPKQDSPSLLDRAKNFGLGAIQGATFSLGDEANGVASAILDPILPESLSNSKPGASFTERYQQGRDAARGINDRAQAQSNGEYGAGQLAGGVLASGGVNPQSVGSAALQFGGLGALQGFGSSDRQGVDLAKDTALGAGLGAAVGAGTQKLGQVLRNAPQSLLESSNENIVKGALNPTKKQLGELRSQGKVQDLGQAVYDAGASKFGDTAGTSAEKLRAAVEDSGGKLSQLYDNAQSLAKPEQLPTTDDILGVIGAHADSLKGNGATIGLVPKIEQKGLDAIQAYGNQPISFPDARQYVSGMQKAFDKGGSQLSIEQERALSMKLREMLNNKVGNVLGSEGALPDANKEISNLIAAKELADKAAAGAQSNRALSLSDNLHGAASAAGTHAGPIGKLAVGGATALASKALRTYGRQALAAGQRSLAPAAEALASMLDRGEPLTNVLQKAAAVGIPASVIESLGGQDGSGNN